MSLKKQGRLYPFSFVKAKTKERKKAFLPENQQQTPLPAAKVFFTTKKNGYEKSKNMNTMGYE